MKIELAQHSGFCMGVRNAVLKIVNEINSSGEPIYVYGPLIHNPQTIDILSRRGLVTINDLSSIDNRTVAIRTHGIPVDEYRIIRSRSNRVINLTCPRVARVQALIKKYAKRGYFILITGDENHAEVVGLKSYASSGVKVISEKSDTQKIPSRDKYLLVSQTTHDRSFFNDISSELKKRFKTIEIIDTICDSTRFRQNDVLMGIKGSIDYLVVVGGRNSANTKRLAMIGKNAGIKTHHIETEDEIDEGSFSGDDRVLVTAGASTPGWIINNVLERLYSIKFSKSNLLIKFLKNIIEFSVRSHLLSSLAALFMTLLIQRYSGMPLDFTLACNAFLYIFSMYSINNFFDRNFLKESNPYKYRIYGRYGYLLLVLSLASIMCSLFLSLRYNTATTAILAVSYFLGIIYSTEPVKNVSKRTGQFLRNVYNSKLIASFGWMVPLCVVPFINYPVNIYSVAVISFMIFSMIFLRHVLMDVIAIQGDLIFGRETLPVIIGIRRIFYFSLYSAIPLICLYTWFTVRFGSYQFLFINGCIIYLLLLYAVIVRLRYLIALKYELLVDMNYIFIMIGTVIMLYV